MSRNRAILGARVLSASSGTSNGMINTPGASYGFGRLPLKLLVSIHTNSHTNSNTFIQIMLCRFSIQTKVSVSTIRWSPEVKWKTVLFSLPSPNSAYLSFFLVVLDRYTVSLLRTLAHLENSVHQAGIFPPHAYSKSDALQISCFCPENVGESTPVESRSTCPPQG